MTAFTIPVDRLAAYPDWARELDARLPVSPQVVLNGNVEDLHLVADAPLWRTATTVGGCLLASGFQAVVGWDVAAGVFTVRGSDEAATRRVLGELPPPGRRPPPTAAELAAVMAAVVGAVDSEGVRIGLVVEGAHRLSADGADPGVHAMYVAARHLVRTAPRRELPGDRRAGLYNTVVWIVDREADLPHWLVSADVVPVVSLPLPELGLRRRVAELYADDLPGFAALSDAGRASSVDTLAALTEGMPLAAIPTTVTLACDRDVPAQDVPDAVRLLRSGLQTSPWHAPHIRRTIRDSVPLFNERVLGQARAVRTVTDILSRAALGLSGAQSAGHPSRPQGVMFFAGPTGVGKTELAKQIATVVFGREEAMRRFDMSEFAAEHSEARLIGSPPGYVGHDAGGELTNAVRQRPFSLLLFDEIEKAHPRILDKFLQILEDGRLTDGSGATVHFTENLIVFTSNLGIYRGEGAERVPIVAPGTPPAEMERRVREAIHQEFTGRIGRPELLNRIGDNIIVFDFIDDEVARKLLQRYLENVAGQVHKRTGIEIAFDKELRHQLAAAVATHEVLAFGGRAVGTVVESRVINPLARALIAIEAPAQVRVLRGWSDAEGHHLEIVRGG
jgi:ATP-dependent Clp protease ATP-binding subunit ClpB